MWPQRRLYEGAGELQSWSSPPCEMSQSLSCVFSLSSFLCVVVSRFFVPWHCWCWIPIKELTLQYHSASFQCVAASHGKLKGGGGVCDLLPKSNIYTISCMKGPLVSMWSPWGGSCRDSISAFLRVSSLQASPNRSWSLGRDEEETGTSQHVFKRCVSFQLHTDAERRGASVWLPHQKTVINPEIPPPLSRTHTHTHTHTHTDDECIH